MKLDHLKLPGVEMFELKLAEFADLHCLVQKAAIDQIELDLFEVELELLHLVWIQNDQYWVDLAQLELFLEQVMVDKLENLKAAEVKRILLVLAVVNMFELRKLDLEHCFQLVLYLELKHL